MRNKLLHPRKTHLIEHISDDARSLRQDDVELQKVLLTGRAIKDLLCGDTVSLNNDSDTSYFSDGNIDLNNIVDASIRYIPAFVYNTTGVVGQHYVNGPLEGTSNEKTCGAMLHTMVVLPDGSLTYETGERESNPSSIRQIFYPDDPSDLDGYTRVGTWNSSTEQYEWSSWVSLSGRMLRIKVLASTKAAVMYNEETGYNPLLPYVIYELHLGGIDIRLPSADSCILATSIAFEQYANTNYTFTQVHGEGTESANLENEPSSKEKYYTLVGNQYIRVGNNGIITEFEGTEKYYKRDSINQWTNYVTYEEYAKNPDGTVSLQTYRTTLMPGIDTTRANTYDSPLEDNAHYEEAHQAIQYRYEVINREESLTRVVDGESVVSSRTWILDTAPEAVDALEGFAELLDAHTDLKIDDILKYDLRVDNVINDYSKPLVICSSANMQGVAKLKLSIVSHQKSESSDEGDGESEEVTVTNLSPGFSISVYKFNEYDGDFDPTKLVMKYIPTQDERPSVYKKYYRYNQISGYYLAGENHNGFLESFDNGVTYYTKEFEPEDTMPVTVCRVNGSYRAARFLSTEESINSPVYVDHDGSTHTYEDVGRAEFLANYTVDSPLEAFIDVARNDTIMVVITSDAHNDDKGIVSPELEFWPYPHDSFIPKLNINKKSYLPEDLQKESLPCSPEESVPSSEVFTKAYKILASNLQKKGLLFGAVNWNASLDSCKSPGIYSVGASALSSGTISGSQHGDKTTFTKGTLFVFSNEVAFTADTLRQSDADAVTHDTSAQIVQVIFGYRNQAINESRPISEIWTRTYVGGYWCPWIRLDRTQSLSTKITSTSVSASKIEELLAAGQAIIVVDSRSPVTINLPDPAYHKGDKVQIEAINTEVHITYSKNSDTYTYTSTTNDKDRMLYPLECDGEYWYVITVT